MNRLLRAKWFPLAFQLLFLIVFVLLAYGGLRANTDDPVFAKVLRNTNLANLIVWSYWWPLLVVSAIFLGRFWCMICPVELVTSLSAKIGFKRKAPRLFVSGWVITIFYITVLFIGIHTLAIHRVPYRMAFYLIGLIGTAIIVGLIFRKNTFCSYVCPIGHLLGLYARIASFGWRVRDLSVCQDCKDKSCIARKNLYKFQARSCGINLVPEKLDDNTDCLLCGQCLKACAEYNPGQAGRPNPGWFAKSFAKDLISGKSISLAQSVFLLVVSGFVVYEILTEWNVTRDILLYLPDLALDWLSWRGTWGTGLIKSVILFLLLPGLIWMLPFALYRIMASDITISTYMKTFGIAFIPIMASAHLAKAILKVSSRVPYWDVSLNDPVGIYSAKAILEQSITLSSNPPWLPLTLAITALVIALSGTVLSIITIKRIAVRVLLNKELLPVYYLIPAIYGGIFIIMLFAWCLHL